MEADKLYPIGKISAMMGVSVQALRFWEKIGLLEPAHVNPETGYRYYEYSQMHKIDRIKYLQNLGVTLQDIKSFYQSESVDQIIGNLKEQREKTKAELTEVSRKLEDLDWYLQYFSFMQSRKHFNVPYYKRFPTRYALVVEMGRDVPFSDTNDRFYNLRTEPAYEKLSCLRQYISVLDDRELRQGRNITLLYGLYLKDEPVFLKQDPYSETGSPQTGSTAGPMSDGLHTQKRQEAAASGPKAADIPEIMTDDPHIIRIPEGEYLCFLARIYREDLWNPSIFERFLEDGRQYLVIADEYEDNLERFDSCMYEVQLIERQSRD